MQIDPARTALININPQVALLHLDPTGRASEAVQAVSSEGVQTAQVTPRRRTTSDPTVLEVAEQTMLLAGGIAVAAPIFPGFLLCIPGLVVFIAPVIAMGLLAAAAGFVILLAVVPVLVTWRLARQRALRNVARRVTTSADVRSENPGVRAERASGTTRDLPGATADRPRHDVDMSATTGAIPATNPGAPRPTRSPGSSPPTHDCRAEGRADDTAGRRVARARWCHAAG